MPQSVRAASGFDVVKTCGWIGAVTIAAALWTSSAGRLTWRHPLPEGVKSPILALELVRDPALVDQIARPHVPSGSDARDEPEQLARSIRIDSAFIAAYAAFFACLGYLMWTTMRLPFRALAPIVAVAGVAAAVFDVRENFAMLRLLDHAQADPRWPSLIKWRFVFLAVACSAPVFVDRGARPLRRWLGYAGGALALAGAFQGMYGTFTENDALVEVGAGRLFTTFLIAVVFLLTRDTLRDGLAAALDRLAARPALAWIAEWPSSDKDHTVGPPVVETPRRS
jgi:hypothetical protein